MNKEVIKKIISFIVQLLSYICLVVLFIASIFFMYYILSSRDAQKKGTKPPISLYTIVTKSMVPNINVYDVIIVKPVTNSSDLKKGDVITFRSNFINTDGYTITHRINDIITIDGKIQYITKGDNNALNDNGYITFENIEGKVTFVIPKLGYLQKIMTSKFGWLLIIVIPAVGIILLDLEKLIRIYRIKNQIEDIPKLKNIKSKKDDKDTENEKKK